MPSFGVNLHLYDKSAFQILSQLYVNFFVNVCQITGLCCILESDWRELLKGSVREELHEFLRSNNDLASYAMKIVAFDRHVQKASHVPLSAKVNAFR